MNRSRDLVYLESFLNLVKLFRRVKQKTGARFLSVCEVRGWESTAIRLDWGLYYPRSILLSCGHIMSLCGDFGSVWIRPLPSSMWSIWPATGTTRVNNSFIGRNSSRPGSFSRTLLPPITDRTLPSALRSSVTLLAAYQGLSHELNHTNRRRFRES